MKKTIPKNQFLPQYEVFEKENLKFGRSIAVSRGVHPFKIKYLPFFEQLAVQLTEQLKRYTNKNFEKYFDFTFRTKAHTRDGLPYINEYVCESSGKVFLSKSTEYRGEFLKLHKDGYAYGSVTMSNRCGFSGSADIWFRWISNIPDYEYIEPDNELELGPEDITFEICTTIPEEYIMRFYAKTAEEYDLNEWKKIINDGHYYPKKRSKNKNDFLYEISESCNFPDVMFLIDIKEPVTEDLCDKIMEEFISFQQEWDTTHFFGIHDMWLVEEISNDNIIKVFVDFGSSNFKIIKSLINWLQKSNLKIKGIKIM